MEFKDVMEKRRAVNFFDSTVVLDESTLREIYELAKFSPSSFNLQPWRVVVVKSEGKREELKKLAMNQLKVTEASAVLVFVGKGKAYESDIEGVLEDRIQKGYMAKGAVEKVKEVVKNLYEGKEVAFASRNTGLFAMAFMMAAESLGWDTHPMDGFDVEGVKKFLDLQEDELPVMMVALGKKREEAVLLPRPARKSFEEVFRVI